MIAPLLTVKDLNVNAGSISLLEGVSFQINAGQSVGLVGESGSGKSMTAWSLMQLLPPGVNVKSGEIWFGEENLVNLSSADMRNIRGSRMAMIFQNPRTALNPVLTIAAQFDDIIKTHYAEEKTIRRGRMEKYLQEVELPDTARVLASYPHQLSGGMLQRVLIAMALSLEPEILLADEPTTALDATIQLQILRLLKNLQQQYNMTLLLISHNIGVISEVCSDLMIMYGGRIVEQGGTQSIIANPMHPYTKALLASRPGKHPFRSQLNTIPGTPPLAGTLLDQCKFNPRCPEKLPHCSELVPKTETIESRRKVACFLYNAQSGS